MSITRLFIIMALLAYANFAFSTTVEEATEDLSLAEFDADADADAEFDNNGEAMEEEEYEAEADEEMEAEADEEEFAFLENTPATNATVPAPTTPLVVANTTGQVFPSVPNPAQACGCYNGGVCKANVCICGANWAGQWCERPSELSIARENEFNRLKNLTQVTTDMSRKLTELEAVAGSPAAVQSLVAEAARTEVARMNLAHASALFDQALARNDLFTARNQLNLIKFLDATRYVELQRQYVLAEERINNQFKSSEYGVKQFTNPIMHDYLYNGVDTTLAKSTDLKGFVRAKEAFDKSVELSQQFNLDFGEPVF